VPLCPALYIEMVSHETSAWAGLKSQSSFTLSIDPPPPTNTHSQTAPVLPSCLSFLKCILIVQKGFAMVFHTCICYTLIRSTLITYSFSISLLPYYSTAYSALLYTIFMHRCNVFWYYLLNHDLSLSFSLSLSTYV
jgi:hypothetical protein